MPDLHPADVRSIRVRILDRDYPLKVRGDKEALTRSLADYVNARLNQLKRQIPNQPDLTLAVLALLQFAEELDIREAQLSQLSAAIEAETAALAHHLDAVLDEAD
ncbi:MAG: cell division protein ZapA [Bacteroidota bacterium]